MSPAAEVIIVGGGIAGLAAAIGLRQRGVEAVVLEQAAELREIGAGLLLGPNACAVLERLGALAPLMDGSSVSVPRWELRDWRGKLLSSLCIAGPGATSLSTRRSDLQAALRGCLPEDAVQLGCGVTRLSPTTDGVRLDLANGQQLLAAKVIVADGAHSTARASLWPGREPTYCGYVGWRGLVDFVPSGWEEPRVCESWGQGRRFGMASVGGGRFYWYASASVPESRSRERIGLSQLKRDFAAWHHPVAGILGAMPEENLLQHPISDRRPCGPWQLEEKVVLVGDAAHPLTPNLGQGASMALEDAWELSVQWGRREAMARYEKRRRGRLHRLWALSHVLGRVIQLQHPALTRARDLHLKLTPDFLATWIMRALLHHVPAEVGQP